MPEKIIQSDQSMHNLMEAVVYQNLLDYVKSGRWLRANPARRDPKTGEYTEGYMKHVRLFEGAQNFFESPFFLSFLGGNRTAQVNLMNKLNRTVDTPNVVMVGDKKVKLTVELLDRRCKMLIREIADGFIV